VLLGLVKAHSSSSRQEIRELKLETLKNQVGNSPSVRKSHAETIQTEAKTIGSYDIKIYGSEFTLVDTPGFDDDKLSDYDVLKLLVEWLARTYKSAKKLNGILYLHHITDARMRGSSFRNLNMFKELVGHDDFYKSVTLGTTCWSLVPNQTAVGREMELKNSSSFWKVLISEGVRLERIPDDATKARKLVYQIASHEWTSTRSLHINAIHPSKAGNRNVHATWASIS
jgi:hypothetical protein